MRINPSCLKTIRRKAGISQQTLADASGITKRTIARIESGGGGETRGSTVNLIAKALQVKPEVLSQEPGSEAVQGQDLLELGLRQVKLPLHGETIISYDLVKQRYGVRMLDIIYSAPLLFTLLAEMSLAERRRHLEEAETALENFPDHLIARHYSALDAERASIGQRDIFTRHIDEHEVNESYYNEDVRNPFSDYLVDQVKRLGLDNEVIDPEEISFDPEGFGSAPLFEKFREFLTDGSFRAHFALTRGFVRIGQIPKELLGDDKEVTPERVKWLEEKVPDEAFAEYESWWKSIDFSLDTEALSEDGDENV